MRSLITIGLLLALLAGGAWGQLPIPAPATTTAPAAETTPVDPLGRTTPSGAVLGFLKAAAAGDYVRAAQYLNTKSAKGQELAEQLHHVMDTSLHSSIGRLSRDPEGDLEDGLPLTKEKVGSVELPSGQFNIELERVTQKDKSQVWQFSAKTLKEVPEAFESTKTPAWVNRLPPFMQRMELLQTPVWRLLMACGTFVFALIGAHFLTRLIVGVVALIVRRGKEGPWAPDRLRSPIRLILLAVGLKLLSTFSTSLLARSIWVNIAISIAILGVAWLVARVGDIVLDLRTRKLNQQRDAGKITVLALSRRLFQLFVAFVTVLVLLERAGVNVNALFAGLGIGGLAVALAARKTVENIFGGIGLISREAMRVGDFCNVNGQMGVVEDIGLGTTRLRTLDRTVVSVPNATLAQVNLENFSMRDKFWLHQIIDLRPGTTFEQVAQVLAAANTALKQNPKVEASTARARFVGFNPNSLKLEVFAYVLDASYEAFLETQEKILLNVLGSIEAVGSGIAIPIAVAAPVDPNQTAKDLEKLAKSSV